MKHELRNTQDKMKRQDPVRQVSWGNYQLACEKRWEQTKRFLPVENYTETLAECWEARLPANKAVRVIAYVEGKWDHEDEECPKITLDFVRENKTALNTKGWRQLVGEQR